MLSFLFLRYLSDNYESAAQKKLGPDYPKTRLEDRRPPLAFWHEGNAADAPAF
jgi:type I restriction enzyme M protein